MVSKSFKMERRVEFCETDAAGICHFSSFFLYMEQIEHAFLRLMGTSVYASAASPDGRIVSWPRVRSECDFHAPARFEELLQMELRLKKLGTKSLVYKIDISRDAEPIASGMTTVVQCELRAGKLVGIPILEPMRSRFEEYLDVDA